jgi:hypothetical protein
MFDVRGVILVEEIGNVRVTEQKIMALWVVGLSTKNVCMEEY